MHLLLEVFGEDGDRREMKRGVHEAGEENRVLTNSDLRWFNSDGIDSMVAIWKIQTAFQTDGSHGGGHGV